MTPSDRARMRWAWTRLEGLPIRFESPASVAMRPSSDWAKWLTAKARPSRRACIDREGVGQVRLEQLENGRGRPPVRTVRTRMKSSMENTASAREDGGNGEGGIEEDGHDRTGTR